MTIMPIARRAVRVLGALGVLCAVIDPQAPAQANSFLCADKTRAGYFLTVKTRDKLNAGTNATLSFSVTGEKYTARRPFTLPEKFRVYGDKSHFLQDHTKDNWFSKLSGIDFDHNLDDLLEQGARNFAAPLCIGERLERILSVTIETDGKGTSPGWYGDHVTVTNPDGWDFVCKIDDWLEDDPITAKCALATCPQIIPGRVGEYPFGCRCAPGKGGTVIGTAAYPRESHLCPSARHAGLIDTNGGAVRVDLVRTTGNQQCGPFKGSLQQVGNAFVKSQDSGKLKDATYYFPQAGSATCSQTLSEGRFSISMKNRPDLYLGRDLEINGGILRTYLQRGMIGIDSDAFTKMRAWIIDNDADFVRNYAAKPNLTDPGVFHFSPDLPRSPPPHGARPGVLSQGIGQRDV